MSDDGKKLRMLRPVSIAAAMLVLSASLQAAELRPGNYVLKRAMDSRHATVCASEAAIGNMIADAVKTASGAELAIVECGAIRGDKLYASGSSFTEAAVNAELPAAQKSVVIEVTGQQILDALEHGFSGLPGIENRFPQVAGLRAEVDLRQPAGLRVVKLTINGNAPDFARTYRLATTENLAGGGEGYAMFAAARRATAGSQSLADAATKLLQDRGVRDVKVLGRIKIR